MMEGASAVDRSVAESMLTETAFWPIWRDEVKPPCCGFCQLGVPEAKVIYWARTTDAGGPVGPQSIVKDGFTL